MVASASYEVGKKIEIHGDDLTTSVDHQLGGDFQVVFDREKVELIIMRLFPDHSFMIVFVLCANSAEERPTSCCRALDV